jgi:MFS family permease
VTKQSTSNPLTEQVPEPQALSRLPAAFRSLRHRNFQLFFSGQLISLTGTWMQNIAQAWLVYRITGSSLLLGSVGFASQIPVFLFAPLGGIIADRHNRQPVVIATQTASMILAFILSVLTLTNTVQVWHIFVLATLLGVVNAFDIPARQAFLVEMVGRDDLMNAIALNSSMFNGARIVGPAIAGILVASIGEGWCFFGNGVSYIAVIVGLLLICVQERRKPPEGSHWQHIIEGFQFARGAVPVRAVLLLLAIVSLVGMPYSVLMPIFADKILHGGARGLGILMGSTGIGALLAGLALAAKPDLKGLSRWIAFAAGGFGVSLALFSLSRHFWLSTALLVPVGFCMMLESSASNTLLQAMVPDELRGRVISIYSMMFMGMAPFGAFFGGALADRIGAPVTVLIGGVACVGAALIFSLRLPAIRVGARKLVLAQAMAGGEPPEEMTTRVVQD